MPVGHSLLYCALTLRICILTMQKVTYDLLTPKNIIPQKWVTALIGGRISTNPTKWSNTLKQLVGKFLTNCLSVFDHFVGFALKGLIVGGAYFKVTDVTYKKIQNFVICSFQTIINNYHYVMISSLIYSSLIYSVLPHFFVVCLLVQYEF